MQQAAIKPKQRYTYADYLQWPEDERWELIEGEAYAMAPAPTRIHQAVVVELIRQIANYLEDKPCKVLVAPFDVTLKETDETEEESQTVVQPDIVVVCDESKLDERGCKGPPDWIIEVLSPATAVRDHVQKKALYEKHGVREYWLIHPTDAILTRYQLENGRYSAAVIEETKDTTPVAVLQGLEIHWGFMAS